MNRSEHCVNTFSNEHPTHLDSRRHVVIPQCLDLRLEELPLKVSLHLQEDALNVLDSLVVFLALEESREEEAKALLDGVVDVLVRAGRL